MGPVRPRDAPLHGGPLRGGARAASPPDAWGFRFGPAAPVGRPGHHRAIVRGEGFVRVFLPFLAPDPKLRGQGLSLEALAPAGVLLAVLGAAAFKYADLLPAAGGRA